MSLEKVSFPAPGSLLIFFTSPRASDLLVGILLICDHRGEGGSSQHQSNRDYEYSPTQRILHQDRVLDLKISRQIQ